MTDIATRSALLQLQKPWYITRLDVDVPGEAVHIFVSHEHGRITAFKAVSMDMWEPYRLAVEEAFPVPRPDIVHDRFHIVSHANKALNEVRKNEVRQLAREGGQDLKGMRQAVLSGADNLPERYEASIAELKASDLRTATGYALKENRPHCWHHRLERTARAHFKSWIRWAKRSALSPFTKVPT